VYKKISEPKLEYNFYKKFQFLSSHLICRENIFNTSIIILHSTLNSFDKFSSRSMQRMCFCFFLVYGKMQRKNALEQRVRKQRSVTEKVLALAYCLLCDSVKLP
jgi:hypothetical protein